MMAKTTFEIVLTLVLGVSVPQLEVECLKGYGTIKCLGTTVLQDCFNFPKAFPH
jgi:hypothetical protein